MYGFPVRLSIGKHIPVLLNKNFKCDSSLELVSAGEPPDSPVDGADGKVTDVLYIKLETLILLLTLQQRHLVVLNQNC